MTSKDAEYSRRYRERHPERRRASVRAYDERNKEKRRDWYREYQHRPETVEIRRARHLMRTYGMTMEEFNALKAIGCPCGQPWDDRPKSAMSAVVDHDWSTGRVRGVIHHFCNRSIGQLGDSAAALQRWIEYLEGR